MSENRIIWSAFVLSLLLHLVLVGVFWRIPLSRDTQISISQAQAQDNVVELILLDENDLDPTLPRTFNEVPERLASEEAPENPDFAAMYNSQAADLLDGGDGNTPSAAEEWIEPQIAIRQDNLSGDGGEAIFNQPLPQTPEQSSQGPLGDFGESENKKTGQDENDLGQWALPKNDPAPGEQNDQDAQGRKEETPELKDWWGSESPTLYKEGQEGEPGDKGFDFNQDEKGLPGAGVSYYGQFSLNTYEWNYAPWLHKFINQLQRFWIAPYAYSRLGMIHGMTKVQLVIGKNGVLESFEILEAEGHQSLHEAAEAGVRAFAPYSALPPNFPKEYLLLTLELYYPSLR